MDTRSEIREFLVSRRAKLKPATAGLADYGPRRVPGLRREEVAVLAGVSATYHTRLERGDLSGVSDSVLEELARALRLDEAERLHLFDLARAARPRIAARPRRRPARHGVRPPVQQVLDALTGAAAFVRNERLDLLASNHLARAVYSQVYDGQARRPANTARHCFLDPRARDFYGDWERSAGNVVAILRLAAGRDPHDRELSDLVGELSTQSEEFRTWWARHDVRLHINGLKHYRHPVVGELVLNFETMPLAADPGLTLVTYSADPASSNEKALRLLGSWAATLERQQTTL